MRPGLKIEKVENAALPLQNQIRELVAQPSPGHVASGRLNDVSIEVNNKVAFINASVDLYDVNLNRKYMWSVRVVDVTSNQEVAHQHYVDQSFTVLKNGYRTATFEDQIELMPGSFRVEIILYKIKPKFDLEKLSDLNYARSSSVVHYGKVVQVLP